MKLILFSIFRFGIFGSSLMETDRIPIFWLYFWLPWNQINSCCYTLDFGLILASFGISKTANEEDALNLNSLLPALLIICDLTKNLE